MALAGVEAHIAHGQALDDILLRKCSRFLGTGFYFGLTLRMVPPLFLLSRRGPQAALLLFVKQSALTAVTA